MSAKNQFKLSIMYCLLFSHLLHAAFICVVVFVESREKFARLHEEEMNEVRQFFENKVLETERSYIEEISGMRERYELELGKCPCTRESLQFRVLFDRSKTSYVLIMSTCN